MNIDNVEKEIIRLHDFFEEWMTGTIEQSDKNFSRFSDSMGDSFYIVAPSGQLTQREGLIKGLYSTYNQRSNMRIWIENVQVHHILDDTVIATYEEWQTLDNKTTARLSTVVFTYDETVANHLLWRCVHETWLPDSEIKDRIS